jgi:Xaa-Pro aminopeptidase
MPAKDYIRLVQRLPKARFEECKDIYFRTRMHKTDEEVAILRKVGVLTDRVVGEVLRAIRPGMTEKQVGRLVVNLMYEGGCDNLKYQVGSGARSGIINCSIINCSPTDKPIEPGDVIRLEVLGDLDHYRSNVTRTAVVGTPTAEQRGIWKTLIAARDTCKTLLRPGTRVADLYRTYVKVCRRRRHRALAQVPRPRDRPDDPRGAVHHGHAGHRVRAEHHVHDGAAVHHPRPDGLPRRGYVRDYAERVRPDHRPGHPQ